jgi:hypothetical protein
MNRELISEIGHSLPMRLVRASHDVRNGLKADLLLCY